MKKQKKQLSIGKLTFIQKINNYIKFWEINCYYNGIPDEVPKEIDHLVPSYKKIAFSILSNDYSLKKLGYQQEKNIYYDTLKKIELKSKGLIKQLTLF